LEWLCEGAFLSSGNPCSFKTRTALGPEPRWEEFRSVSIAESPSSKLLVKVYCADLMSGRAVGGGAPMGTGVVMLSAVIDSKGLFDAWIPLEGATKVPRPCLCPCAPPSPAPHGPADGCLRVRWYVLLLYRRRPYVCVCRGAWWERCMW